MVRRLKSEVLTQLPPKRRQQVFLSLDEAARKELAAMRGQLEAARAATAAVARQSVASHGAVAAFGGRVEENRALMELYRRGAELKAGAVQEYVTTLLEGGQKFLVFAHHKELMNAVEHACNRFKGCRSVSFFLSFFFFSSLGSVSYCVCVFVFSLRLTFG
jgi:SWI/SNF-related matrix-associated actin-dependent regulator of chromatin subfamily A-like protein 1